MLKPNQQVPGYCVSCTKPVHRRSKRGAWYKLCDDCRTTDAKPGSWTDEVPVQPPPVKDRESRYLPDEPVNPAPDRVPHPQTGPEECLHCGTMVQPAYIEAHMAGRDVNHPECPLFDFKTSISPSAAPKSDDNPMTMRF
jgi:hypothetical protein